MYAPYGKMYNVQQEIRPARKVQESETRQARTGGKVQKKQVDNRKVARKTDRFKNPLGLWDMEVEWGFDRVD